MFVLIGVTGATGEVGGRVARRLAERGASQRLIVRDPSRAPELEGAEVRAAASYGAREEMTEALTGVDTLFLVPAAEAADRIEQHRTAVGAAVDAGVERLVYLSFVGAAGSSFTLGREHGVTEDIVKAAGIAYTFPRMNLYMDFLPSMVGEDGAIRGPAGDGRLAAVLRDDVADAVAAILTEPARHDGRSYDLTGREALTLAEAAEELGARFENETLEEARASRAGYGAPGWQVEAWVTTYVAIANGELEHVSDDVERLTGHPPKTLREYLAGSTL
jgi:uncharacterized protein YbjT (DUF2867 family)